MQKQRSEFSLEVNDPHPARTRRVGRVLNQQRSNKNVKIWWHVLFGHWRFAKQCIPLRHDQHTLVFIPTASRASANGSVGRSVKKGLLYSSFLFISTHGARVPVLRCTLLAYTPMHARYIYSRHPFVFSISNLQLSYTPFVR